MTRTTDPGAQKQPGASPRGPSVVPPAGAPVPLDPPSWLDRSLRLCATALPFGLALLRAAPTSQWRDDLPAVRDLGLVAVGLGGGVSTLLTQALGLMPLGSRSFRAAFGAALALAIAARLFHDLCRRLLLSAMDLPPARPGKPAEPPRLPGLLATIATLTAALSPTWQREGTVGGGAMLAVALALGCLTLALRCVEPRRPASPRAWIGFGALTGATFAESPPAALAVVAAVGTLLAVRRFGRTPEPPVRLPIARTLVGAAIAALLTTLLLLAPLALRPFAPRTFVDIGRALSTAGLSGFDTASARTTALGAWIHEVGLVSLGIAAFGAGTALLRGKSRALIAPFLAWILLDTLLPARAAGVLSADPLTALRSLAVAAVAMGSALGVLAVTRRLLVAKIPMARAAAVLMVIFHLTLVALTSEEAGFAADRSEQLAAETWSDEAYGRLEPRSAVLVRSPALAWRLWASRLLRGQRPDVLVIPIPLLSRGRVAKALLAEEQELGPLLRDFALTGEPSEFALSKLADMRPLHVELDAAWTKRESAHLRADGLWLSYAPQPLGPSDRKLGAGASRVPIERVLTAVNATTVPDAPTGNLLAQTLRAHGDLLLSLGETELAEGYIERLGELGARDPFAGKLAVPYARKGLRRALLRKPPSRAAR
ncbi:MAG: hypothetical protein U0359_26045 [Byssovorax sp.]